MILVENPVLEMALREIDRALIPIAIPTEPDLRDGKAAPCPSTQTRS